MKKRMIVVLLSLIAVVILCFGLTACGEQSENGGGNSSKHEHSFSTEWSSDATYHWHNCTSTEGTCDSPKKDVSSHTWNDGEITTQATVEQDGIITYTCLICGKTKDEIFVYFSPEHEHQLVYHIANVADCTNDGNIAYWQCDGCSMCFSDENAETEIKLDQIIIRARHNYIDGICVDCGSAMVAGIYDEDYILLATYADSGMDVESDYIVPDCYEMESAPTYVLSNIYPSATYIVLPNNIKKIGDCSFMGCSGLKNVTIPNSVLSIGDEAFYNCYSLKDIVIPISVNSIGRYAFAHCDSFESLTIPDSVTSIGESAFSNCSIKNATIPALAAGYIDNSALKTVVITSGDNICSSAFAGSVKLTSVIIPNSVRSIGYNAFEGCSSLETIEIPDSVSSIGWYAFQNCKSLESVTIGEGVTNIGIDAFYGCISLVNINYNAIECEWDWEDVNNRYTFYETGCKGDGIHITIGKNVKSIPAYLFCGSYNISEVVFEKNSVCESIGDYAFRRDVGENSNIVNIDIPNSLKSIGNNAFAGCASLKSIDFGEESQLTSIGNNAFAGCVSLKSINFGVNSRLAYIGYESFAKCSSLTNIVIPKYVTSIGWNAFLDCTSLANITIDENSLLESIGYMAFENCTSLLNIYIPKNVSLIGGAPFAGCTSLINITVADDNIEYKSINGNLYSEDEKLFIQYASGKSDLSFQLTNQIEGIEQDAFNGCQNLESILIGNGITIIASGTFRNCKSLISVTIPSSVSRIDSGAFDGCTALVDIIVADNNAYYKSISGDLYDKGGENFVLHAPGKTENTVFIPNGVQSIDDGAFRDNTSLVSIIIPDSVTNIGSGAFERCTALTSVTLGNGLTSIDLYAFAGCTALTSVTLGNSLTSIGYYAFAGCTALTNITIPNSVTSIGSCAFENCASLTSIVIPNSVTRIEDATFSDCIGLTSVIIGDDVTNIGYGAFYGCVSLRTITIGSGVLSIVSDAFGDCYSLIEVYNLSSLEITAGDINNGGVARYAKNVYTPTSGASKLTKQGEYVFFDDTANGGEYYLIAYTGSQIQLILPDSFNGNNYSIYQYAFYGLSELESITIGNGVQSIGDNAFEGCTSLVNIVIANSVKNIGSFAFSDCVGLISITIPSSVTHIGYTAFGGCTGLTIIELPNSITSMASYVFSGCTDLTRIIFNGTVEQWEAITKYSNWNLDTGSYIIHCIDGDIAKQ